MWLRTTAGDSGARQIDEHLACVCCKLRIPLGEAGKRVRAGQLISDRLAYSSDVKSWKVEFEKPSNGLFFSLSLKEGGRGQRRFKISVLTVSGLFLILF